MIARMLGFDQRAHWLLGAAFSFALIGGCFKDTGGAEGSGGCPEGTMGCACYGNGTCDASLECREGACVPVGCTAGSEDCVCVDGECLGDLACTDGVCTPPSGGTGETGDTGTTTDETGTTDTSTTTDATQTGPNDTSTTDPTDTMGSSSVSTDTTTMGGSCDEQGDCLGCIECEAEAECAEQWAACEQADACMEYVQCALECQDDTCWSECKGVAPDTYQVGDALFSCTCEPCVDSCQGITDPVCNG